MAETLKGICSVPPCIVQTFDRVLRTASDSGKCHILSQSPDHWAVGLNS
jgi:hypothetical protein